MAKKSISFHRIVITNPKKPTCITNLIGEGAPLATNFKHRGFYIFTIITNVTHQIIIFRLAPTTIPVERSLTYNFTTFAHVASHAGMTRWHPVSSLVSNVLRIPDLLLSLPL